MWSQWENLDYICSLLFRAKTVFKKHVVFATNLACQRRIFWSLLSSHLGLCILHKKNNIQILKVM